MAMAQERARYWRHPGLPEVGLLRARFVEHRFGRHVHEGYTIGVIEHGIEEFDHEGELVRAGAGAIVIVNPDTVHTGQAAGPEGWAYRAAYPSIGVMTEIAAELGLRGGTPRFPRPVVDDPEVAELQRAAYRAAEHGDALAASTRLRTALAALLRRHATLPGDAAPPAAASRRVREAREILHERLVDPPSLGELAATVDASPYALLRAFRAATGLPPHAYLNDVRVRRASELLGGGAAPADVAFSTGFADQAHLTRHFKRVVGVTPGAYRRSMSGRNNVQDSPERAA